MGFIPAPWLLPVAKVIATSVGGGIAATLCITGHPAAGHEVALVTAALVAALGAHSLGDGLRAAVGAALAANVSTTLPPPAEGPTP